MINGIEYEYTGTETLSALLKKIGVNPSHVAVMINEMIIHRDKFDSQTIEEFDSIEIFQLVGGG